MLAKCSQTTNVRRDAVAESCLARSKQGWIPQGRVILITLKKRFSRLSCIALGDNLLLLQRRLILLPHRNLADSCQWTRRPFWLLAQEN